MIALPGVSSLETYVRSGSVDKLTGFHLTQKDYMPVIFINQFARRVGYGLVSPVKYHHKGGIIMHLSFTRHLYVLDNA